MKVPLSNISTWFHNCSLTNTKLRDKKGIGKLLNQRNWSFGLVYFIMHFPVCRCSLTRLPFLKFPRISLFSCFFFSSWRQIANEMIISRGAIPSAIVCPIWQPTKHCDISLISYSYKTSDAFNWTRLYYGHLNDTRERRRGRKVSERIIHRQSRVFPRSMCVMLTYLAFSIFQSIWWIRRALFLFIHDL